MVGNIEKQKIIEASERLMRSTVVPEARGESDTIKLWENFREQALLWRTIALLQFPTTILAIILSLAVWHNRKIVLNVPREPLPGMYSVHEIPDHKYVEAATEFVNLISTYQPTVARRQFFKAAEMIVEPLLSKYNIEMLGSEIQAIEQTNRTQIFFVDPSKTTIKRQDRAVTVTLMGSRLKLVAGRELPSTPTAYEISLATLPRNVINPLGIVITNVLMSTGKI